VPTAIAGLDVLVYLEGNKVLVVWHMLHVIFDLGFENKTGFALFANVQLV
jgi:hypothetical protein